MTTGDINANRPHYVSCLGLKWDSLEAQQKPNVLKTDAGCQWTDSSPPLSWQIASKTQGQNSLGLSSEEQEVTIIKGSRCF